MVKGMDVPANKKNCLLYRTAVFQDENRFSTCRIARLDLKRAVKARLYRHQDSRYISYKIK
jgi:hypothetical protein